MDSQSLFVFLSFLLLSFLLLEKSVVEGRRHPNSRLYSFKPTKLFVFGDSYADTGNIAKSLSNSWRSPYGVTFPGKPAGRFSDGRVSTDFLAKFVGIESPIPYKWMKDASKSRLKYGMNFAYGGTGVFDTMFPLPNMTTQIDFFQQLIHDRIFCPSELHSSIALVSVAGNDYSSYVTRSGSTNGIEAFIKQVVNQTAVNLKRIHSLGVKKIVIASMQPLGCLPSNTVISSFQRCNETANVLTNIHNVMLHQAVAKINNETKESTVVILDLYDAFMSVFTNKEGHPGSTTFENPLKPCCVGVSDEYSCANVENGVKKYTVCDNPKSAFFWDNVHPTEEGWRAVYSVLHDNLKRI